MSSLLLGAYAAGALVALVATDDRLPVRLALAVSWPLGPLALALVLVVLLATAAVVWPWVGGVLLGAGIAAWWALG